MEAAGFGVEITVKGRVGAATQAAVGFLDVEVVPRHDVVVVPSGKLSDLLAALAVLERLGVEVDRISQPGRLVPDPAPGRLWP